MKSVNAVLDKIDELVVLEGLSVIDEELLDDIKELLNEYAKITSLLMIKQIMETR